MAVLFGKRLEVGFCLCIRFLTWHESLYLFPRHFFDVSYVCPQGVSDNFTGAVSVFTSLTATCFYYLQNQSLYWRQ